MNDKLSVIDLIITADIVVQLIMLLLIIASIISWTIIFAKKSVITKDVNVVNNFYKQFHANNNIDDCIKGISGNEISNILLRAKYDFKQGGVNIVEQTYRSINLLFNEKVNKLESGIQVLAIIGSNAPYVGLFGTVWGIMHSFLGLASVKQATIAVVAPGIAEALIATAFGLFAAIPASIFYNKFTADIDNIYQKYQKIADEYLIIMQRSE